MTYLRFHLIFNLPLLILLPLACLLLAPGTSWPRRMAGPVFSLVLGGAMIGLGLHRISLLRRIGEKR